MNSKQCRLEKISYSQTESHTSMTEALWEIAAQLAEINELKRPIKETSEYDDMVVSCLPIGTHTLNCLAMAGIKTIGELLKWRRPDLRSTRGLGKITIKDIEEALAERGLSLRK
jgi:DNA-directed RNA polymerase alpha subunit